MAETTKIEWCDSTFSPWVGCTKVSGACQNCYAEAWAKRAGSPGLWTGQRRRTSPALWRGPLKWNAAAQEFHAARGRRQRVFCASLADVFDNQVPVFWREDLWTLIRLTPNLDWLLLTKRPQNIRKMLPPEWPPHGGWSNVWLGTTAEDQKHYNERFSHLQKIPAHLNFISYEPALGPIDDIYVGGHRPDWIIAGGESGPKARAPKLEWFRNMRDQCVEAGIPFLMKQWGEWIETDGEAHRVGKKAAGRLLDGIEHNGFPAAG